MPQPNVEEIASERDVKKGQEAPHRPYFIGRYKIDNGKKEYEHSSLSLVVRVPTVISVGGIYFLYRTVTDFINEKFELNLPNHLPIIAPEFEHKCNPLHIYCRLIDLGLSTKSARKKSMFYEKYFFRPFVYNGNGKNS